MSWIRIIENLWLRPEGDWVVIDNCDCTIYQEQQKSIKSFIVIEMCANGRNLNFMEENMQKSYK